MSNEYIFEAKNIHKYFGPTHANNDVSIAIKKGEIRGLIGENGSGKSTLISMISGIIQKDGGEMFLKGEPYLPTNSLDASRNKIGTIVQELGLVDGLPVGVNIFLGRTSMFSKNGIIDLASLYKAANEQIAKWGFTDLNVLNLASTLSVEQKKLVELVRALSVDPDLLILDEITAAISHNNREILYRIIQSFREQGKSVLIITHDIEEIISITDNITVMRDGAVVGTKKSSELTPDSLKHLMVGRDLSGSYYRDDKTEQFSEEVVLNVRALSVDKYFSDISFDLHKGEILGVCGLSDAGIHELGETLFGIRKPSGGYIMDVRKNEKIKSPTQAMKLGFGYVPKDRDKQALMVNATIQSNVCLPSVKQLESKVGFLSPRKMNALAQKVVKEFEVKTNGIFQFINGLSGGNRQKVNLARWMTKDIGILILDCPTRGVDVGVKAYIYNAMDEARKRGMSIVMISDELPELIGMSDRLLVVKDGKIVDTVNRSSGFTEESIIEVMI